MNTVLSCHASLRMVITCYKYLVKALRLYYTMDLHRKCYQMFYFIVCCFWSNLPVVGLGLVLVLVQVWSWFWRFAASAMVELRPWSGAPCRRGPWGWRCGWRSRWGEPASGGSGSPETLAARGEPGRSWCSATEEPSSASQCCPADWCSSEERELRVPQRSSTFLKLPPGS